MCSSNWVLYKLNLRNINPFTQTTVYNDKEPRLFDSFVLFPSLFDRLHGRFQNY